MKTETRTPEQRDTQTKTPAAPTPTLPIETVLDSVRRDSSDTPQDYLDETVVPHGGE